MPSQAVRDQEQGRVAIACIRKHHLGCILVGLAAALAPYVAG
jgi:hypothetical protein